MVERVFGSLIKKFQIVYRPCRLWKGEGMNIIVKTWAILHNMSVEKGKENSTGIQAIRLADEDNTLVGVDDTPLLRPPTDVQAASAFWQAHLEGIEDSLQHLRLDTHRWITFGLRRPQGIVMNI